MKKFKKKFGLMMCCEMEAILFTKNTLNLFIAYFGVSFLFFFFNTVIGIVIIIKYQLSSKGIWFLIFSIILMIVFIIIFIMTIRNQRRFQNKSYDEMRSYVKFMTIWLCIYFIFAICCSIIISALSVHSSMFEIEIRRVQGKTDHNYKAYFSIICILEISFGIFYSFLCFWKIWLIRGVKLALEYLIYSESLKRFDKDAKFLKKLGITSIQNILISSKKEELKVINENEEMEINAEEMKNKEMVYPKSQRFNFII